MIKANDLRLGNIVQRPEHLRIDMLDGGDIYFRVNSTMIRDCEHYKEDWAFEPIELTADVLGKIKDVKVESDKRFLYDTADWRIYFVKAELPKWELHWLQNYIYFRTGTELSITL